MSLLQNLVAKIAPPGTTRAQLPQLVREAFRVWNQEGFDKVLLYTSRIARSHWEGLLKQYGLGKPPYSYAEWIVDHEPDAAALANQRVQRAQLPYVPLFSIITPVYNPPVDVLREAIQSVTAQSYENWQLILVDGASDRAGIHQLLEQQAQSDARIQVVHLEENRGISANSNVALELAEGEFVSLLDHDDLLAPNALFEVAALLNAPPQIGNAVDVIYFDEDKISADGSDRRSPWFKPDFAPDTLLSNNILMHCVIRRTLLQQIGGFDSAMDGAQDWDVALRLSEVTDKILHIPKVLYHWRQIEGSAALDANAKPWAYDAQARCMKAHLARLGAPDAGVSFPALGLVHINWPTGNAKVSIIIPTKDKADLLRACIDSILTKSTYPHYEIIVVDTGSTEAETLAYFAQLRQDPRVKIITYSGRFNFGKANNWGARHAAGDLLLFLNNDTEVLEPAWLEEMVGWAMRPETGVVGAKLLRPDGTIQHAGLIMGMLGHGSHVFEGGHEHEYGIFGSPEWVRNYQAVTGACMMVRRAIFEEVGGFDEVYEIGYSDIELCLRINRAGYRTVYTPFARLLHQEGGSRGLYLPPADVVRATLQMWPTIQPGDPNFNPNLSYMHRVPRLAIPKAESSAQRLLHILRLFGLVPAHATASVGALSCDDGALPQPVAWPGEHKQPGTVGPKRLLFISHDFSLSGAPLMLYSLAKHLSAEGYQVRVYAPKVGALQEMYSQVGIETAVEPALITDIRASSSIVTQGYDLVVANTIISWQLVHVARAFQVPVIWWIHESHYGQALAQKQRPLADAFAVADQVLFPAHATAQLYATFRSAQNVSIIPCGLETAKQAPDADAAPPASTQNIGIVHIGSIEPRKGQDVFVKSLKLLPKAVQSNITVSMLGRSLDARFERKVQRAMRTLDFVELVGEAPYHDTMARLQAADIFVLSSRDEVLPVTIMEAMFHGKAIISTRVGGVAEIIDHGQSGLLVDVEDHRALAEKLALLCGDAALRQRLGEAARQTFHERLTMQQFGPAFEQLMAQVVCK